MATRTLSQIVIEAYKLPGLVPDNVTAITAEKSQRAVQKFNELLAMLSAKGIVINTGTQESFTLTAGTASYTIGSGGTFDTTRPEKILNWWIRDSGGIDYTDTAIWGSDRYQGEAAKTTSARPYGLWYQPTFPLGKIWLYPTPDAAEDLYLYSEKPLTEVTTLTDSISLPNEYLLMLESNLGVLLCAGKKQPPPDLLGWASLSLEIVENKNLGMQLEKMEISGFPYQCRVKRTTIYNIGS